MEEWEEPLHLGPLRANITHFLPQCNPCTTFSPTTPSRHPRSAHRGLLRETWRCTYASAPPAARRGAPRKDHALPSAPSPAPRPRPTRRPARRIAGAVAALALTALLAGCGSSSSGRDGGRPGRGGSGVLDPLRRRRRQARRRPEDGDARSRPLPHAEERPLLAAAAGPADTGIPHPELRQRSRAVAGPERRHLHLLALLGGPRALTRRAGTARAPHSRRPPTRSARAEHRARS